MCSCARIAGGGGYATDTFANPHSSDYYTVGPLNKGHTGNTKSYSEVNTKQMSLIKRFTRIETSDVIHSVWLSR